MPTSTSTLGIMALRGREGCKLKAYRDSVGVWTIGVGHTGRTTGDKVTEGMVITQAQADLFLSADLRPVEAVVNKELGSLVVTQNEFDAIVSWLFNVGANHFASSTVLRKLRAGDRKGAADAFMLWNKPAEILGRRKTEMVQFLTPYTGPVPVAPKASVAVLKEPEAPSKTLPFFAGFKWPF